MEGDADVDIRATKISQVTTITSTTYSLQIGATTISEAKEETKG